MSDYSLTMTLNEALDESNDPIGLIDELGYDHYKVKELGGDFTINLDLEIAKEFGIVRFEEDSNDQ